MSSSKKAIIVGGSLGGLFTGIVLKRLGHKVTIFERSPTPLLHDQGAGIVAGGDTLEFLTRFDKTKREIAVTSPVRHYLNEKGEEIRREELPQKMTRYRHLTLIVDRSWDLLYHVLRANFDGVSSDYVQPPADPGEVTYEYGCTVTGIKEDKNSPEMIVTYQDREKNERTARASRVFAADGPSSTIRRILLPQIQRSYAGYVAWRGTVLESRVSEPTKEALVEKFTFYLTEGTQILSYVIPGENGSLERGRRLINWVWYTNYKDKTKVMTDVFGEVHQWTNKHPSDELIQNQKSYATKILPSQFAEVVELTERPFIQAITDVLSSQTVFYDGRVVLVGDAVAGFRPHTAGSTSQAAFHALELDKYLRAEKFDWRSFERDVKRYAEYGVRLGIQLGNRSQFQRRHMGT